MTSMQKVLGSIDSLRRYPVKSMTGEELNAAEVTKDGLLGDRAYALVDSLDGKVASAKNPRKWPTLFDFRAVLADATRASVKVPPVRIALPQGTIVNSEQPDVHRTLSNVLKREATLSTLSDRRAATADWPDIGGLDHRDAVTDFGLPDGTFFDCAFVHLLTTATLGRLRVLYPEGHFEVRRFRPNIIVETTHGEKEFTECLDRANRRDRRCCSPEHHWPLRPVRDDDAPSGRSPERCGDPAYGSPAQPR
jgi:uncharacterized protein